MHLSGEYTILSESGTRRDKGSVPRPQQQKSRLKIRRSTDFRSQRMIKFNGIGNFHSLAEYYHAALLEGDHLVDAYVPQPYRLRLGRKTYIPDIYYVRDGQRYVGELKPRSKFDDTLRIALTEYFRAHDIMFVVIDNESIYARSMEAQNWLTVVRWLLTYKDLDTHKARLDVLRILLKDGEISYGDIADLGHRNSRLAHECAIHRMLHAGEIEANFDEQFFGTKTVLRLC